MESILKQFEAATKADIQPLLRQKGDLATAAAKLHKAREKTAVAERRAAERHTELDRGIGIVEGREARGKAREQLARAAESLGEARAATGQAKAEYSRLATARNAATGQITQSLADLLRQARAAFDQAAIGFIREGDELHNHIAKIAGDLATSNGEGHQAVARALAPMAAKLDLFRAQFRGKDF